MTTGSIVRSDNTRRVIDTLSWTGGDRPKTPRISREKRRIYTVTRDGKRYSFLIAALSDSRPVKRELNKPNAYNKQWNYRYSGDSFTYLNNFNDALSNAVELVGFPGFNGLITPPSIEDARALITANSDIRLLEKLREKLYGSDFNLSVTLGESRQALELIADSALRVATSLRRLRRGDLAGAAKSLVDGTSRKDLASKRDPRLTTRSKLNDSLSNDWLALQYGWLPLLKDTEAAALHLAHALNAPQQKRYSVQTEKRRTWSVTQGGSSPVDARYYPKFSTLARKKITVYIRERPSSFYQLGLQNPEIVAWELMPWSFVIDWFIPIGQYLNARAAVSAIRGTYVVSSLSEARYLGCTGRIKQPYSGKYVRGEFVRTVSETPPKVPMPSFKGFDQAFSWKRCVNSLALLTKMAPKGPRG